MNPCTVVRAYQDLEARGLIESRPRSGYYVCIVAPRRVPELAATSPRQGPTPVVAGDLIVELVQAMSHPHLISFGIAVLNPELFAVEDLNRTAARVVRRLKPARLVRDLTPGDPELRRRIALRYLESGRAIAAEEIVITNGGLEAVILCMRALTSPGDTVAIETPNARPLHSALAGMGLRVREIPTHPRTGADLAALEDVFRSQSVKVCLVMPTFQNPLGSRMPDESKRSLAKLVARYEVPLIENDTMAEMYLDGVRPRPVKSFDDSGCILRSIVITVSSST